MPKLREQTAKLKKITTRIDTTLAEQVSNAMAKLGMQSRAEFIRISIAEKANIVLNQDSKTREAH
jgi:metal-responsive CopG/Arc/MetJ family transcriptional regulator